MRLAQMLDFHQLQHPFDGVHLFRVGAVLIIQGLQQLLLNGDFGKEGLRILRQHGKPPFKQLLQPFLLNLDAVNRNTAALRLRHPA